MVLPPESLTFIGAELFFLIVRSRDLKTLAKRNDERTEHEQRRVARGLARSIGMEAIVFVPASAALLVLLSPLFIPPSTVPQKVYALYTLIGIGSYGFPFATVRGFVRRVALNSLKEFANISVTPPPSDDEF